MESDWERLQEEFRLLKWAEIMARMLGLWPRDPNPIIFTIVVIYAHLLMFLQLVMGEEVTDAYRILLLVYFLSVNFMLCILGYKLLISFMTNNVVEIVQYTIYFIEMYTMLAIYCMISEHLTSESLKCGEAFYQCPWYNFPLDCTKDIIFIIARSQRPLGLQAGKFTTFSSVTLTDVSKTAAGYLSVLRNFLIIED
ncbi:hypothetical protein KQX54_016746 [Cotesia glomerata]|uniref:Odorant receptor n=1 Tax=Cotesia glomerata TaxID=32391 RepID=A0AAV7HXT9_COTGL|nr:hypothetical protein KQX54_016746 [Cotesia glomerata]